MTNLISVVVTCYNHENYIEQCLRSIFNQTYRNIELIVLDDGSTDYSPEIIQEVLKESPFVTTFESHENIGVVRTRNKGLNLLIWCRAQQSDSKRLTSLFFTDFSYFICGANSKTSTYE